MHRNSRSLVIIWVVNVILFGINLKAQIVPSLVMS